MDIRRPMNSKETHLCWRPLFMTTILLSIKSSQTLKKSYRQFDERYRKENLTRMLRKITCSAGISMEKSNQEVFTHLKNHKCFEIRFNIQKIWWSKSKYGKWKDTLLECYKSQQTRSIRKHYILRNEHGVNKQLSYQSNQMKK